MFRCFPEACHTLRGKVWGKAGGWTVNPDSECDKVTLMFLTISKLHKSSNELGSKAICHHRKRSYVVIHQHVYLLASRVMSDV